MPHWEVLISLPSASVADNGQIGVLDRERLWDNNSRSEMPASHFAFSYQVLSTVELNFQTAVGWASYYVHGPMRGLGAVVVRIAYRI